MASFFKKDRFSHQKSAYERPQNNFKCGRAAVWGKPCARGASADGQCLGVSECLPFKVEDRWECRRPQNRGGRCEQGPNPDGSCCSQQLPCAPVPTLRSQRGRITRLAIYLSVAVIIGSLFAWQLPGLSDQSKPQIDAAYSKLSMGNPGTLSDAHRAFSSSGDGCNSCHVGSHSSGSNIDASLAADSEVANSESLSSSESVDSLEAGSLDINSAGSTAAGHDAGSIMPASFRQLVAHKDVSEGCVNCHQFEGPALQAHNSNDYEKEVNCQSCHVEHKGRFADLTQVTDQQCASCHQDAFDSFAKHPEFREKFPSDTGSGIIFDHDKHLRFHFKERKYTERAPQNCTTCHQEEGATRRVQIRGFDEACSSCHLNNIVNSGKSELAVLSLPKLKLKKADDVKLFRQCGAKRIGKFKSAGSSRSNPFMNWLVDADFKKTSEFSVGYCDLLQKFSEGNLSALVEAINARGIKATPAMFEGVNFELLKQLGATWIGNERYRAPKVKLAKGFDQRSWYVNKKGELNYKATDHADTVIMAWVDFALELKQTKEDKLSQKLANSILDDEKGAGSCAKCHDLDRPIIASVDTDAVGAVDPSSLVIKAAWKSVVEPAKHRFKFNHSAHLSLVGAMQSNLSEIGAGCGVCHSIDQSVDYEASARLGSGNDYTSNFSPVKKDTCAQCHNESSIRDDCSLCHAYHESPSFTLKISQLVGEDQ